jgi:hypothetical protein
MWIEKREKRKKKKHMPDLLGRLLSVIPADGSLGSLEVVFRWKSDCNIVRVACLNTVIPCMLA